MRGTADPLTLLAVVSIMNRFVCGPVDPIRTSRPDFRGRREAKGIEMVIERRRGVTPVRLTLTSEFGDNLGGAWWQRTESVADELPGLAEALQSRLGRVEDIEVSWSPWDGVPDLDLLTRRGVAAMPGLKDRPQRMMAVVGSEARVTLLVIPSRTTTNLALLILRRAVGLSVDGFHQESPAYSAAEDIVHAAQVQCARWRKTA